jgi:4-hydroxybenzoate polyprenyltransferase
MRSLAPTLRAWLQLLRPPNLFTVPGDPLAGFAVAQWAAGSALDPRQAALPAAVSLLFYVGGLIANDAADLVEDRRDRPQRPIPSGRVSLGAAVCAAVACGVTGVLLALAAGRDVFFAAVFTQTMVMAYNGGLKRFAIAGALTMGACRGGSVLIGAAAAGAPLAAASLLLATGTTLYIAAVTWVADRETETIRLGLRRWLPAAALTLLVALAGFGAAVGWFSAKSGGAGSAGLVALLLGSVAVAWAGRQGWLLRGTPPPPVVGRAIGALIRGLLPVQAAGCVLGGIPGLAVAAGLLVCWPLSTAVGKRFYAS